MGWKSRVKRIGKKAVTKAPVAAAKVAAAAVTSTVFTGNPLPGALTEAAHQAKKGATYAGKTLVSGESDE